MSGARRLLGAAGLVFVALKTGVALVVPHSRIALPAGHKVLWRVDEDEVIVQAGKGKQTLDRGRTGAPA